MKLDYDNQRTRSTSAVEDMAEAEMKSEAELFDAFYEAQNGQPMSEEQRSFAKGLLERLKEEMA